jgi:hypothetical protein
MEQMRGLDPKALIQEVDGIDEYIEYMSGLGQVLVTVVMPIGLF